MSKAGYHSRFSCSLLRTFGQLAEMESLLFKKIYFEIKGYSQNRTFFNHRIDKQKQTLTFKKKFYLAFWIRILICNQISNTFDCFILFIFYYEENQVIDMHVVLTKSRAANSAN